MAHDLVCGMQGDFKIKAGYKNKDYYFCSESCRSAFVKNPEQFLK